MSITVKPESKLVLWHNHVFQCALGRGGVGINKTEGDGVTPIGSFPLRQVFFRPDRVAPPITSLSCVPLRETDGWCDDPDDPRYNRFVQLPYAASHEKLWRDDHVYDLIVVLGYNDMPVEPGKGSAIFLHIATEDYSPTEGCVAMAEGDLRALLAQIEPHEKLVVRGGFGML